MFCRWWKEQLRKKHKQKRADFDTGRKTKSPEKLVDETTDETNDVTPVKRDDRKRKRKGQIVERISEDSSFNQPKKKKRDTTDSPTESVENSTDSTVKKKYILFVGELNMCLVSCAFNDIAVGNVPFSATAEDITAHFQRAGYNNCTCLCVICVCYVQIIGIKVVDFRLLTKKSGSSKGCGFMELKSSKQLQVSGCYIRIFKILV